MALIAGMAIYGFAQTYSNPILHNSCPDPTVIDDRAHTGWFYAYSTQSTVNVVENGSSKGVFANLPIYRSKDLVNWEFVCDGFPNGRPAWVEGSSLWAPDITYVDGRYVLYYALGVWGALVKEGCGVAVSDSPLGPFKDLGCVVSYKTIGVKNSIDPNFFEDTNGKRYLYWGSLGSGIHGIRLSKDGLSVKKNAKPVYLSAKNMEAAYMYKRNGWYYLFASMGSCCERDRSTYRIVVARSKKPLGPFKGPDGQEYTDDSFRNAIMTTTPGSKLFAGPGHNSEIITDAEGNDWMLYHTYWKENGYNGRLLAIDRIVWDEEGWPHFDCSHPSETHACPVF